jgi:exosortase A-associated hydrolase 2
VKAGSVRLEALHLPGERRTFALYRSPAGAIRGSIVYVHPFAEEMNKARRMAALQASAFAAAGFAVLQVDLHGCGDSEGDSADARWSLWKRDVERAAEWLDRRADAPIHLWGLRLGATLALACWRDAPTRYGSAILWQPVHDGRSFVTQFLRLAVAREALRERGERVTTDALRARLSAGETLEVAGYHLPAELAAAIDAQRLADWFVHGARVHWLDVKAAPGDAAPATHATLEAWKSRGVDAGYRAIAGQPFWSSNEIIEVPALIAATTSLYAQ